MQSAIVTITVRKPRSAAFKASVLESVYESLVEAGGAHPQDRFRRVHELDPENFRFDPRFPDLETARRGLNPEHMMVFFQDVPWEAISTGGGRIPHA
jgi:hypothetical protein